MKLEINKTVTEIKNAFNCSSIDLTLERTNRLEEKSIAITQTEIQQEKRNEKKS